jgi:5'(3')-deoxyribonucleotidase
MIILVDMDDTIEYLLKAWVDGVNQKYGRSVSPEDVVTWNVADAYPGLSFEQVYEVPMQPGFWKHVEPIPGAAEALQRLMAAGHEVYIVTATPYQSVTEKMTDVLFRYFPFLSWKQLIVTGNKQLLRGDVLIDDGVHNLEGGEYVKILMTAPHNRSYDAEANGMFRVRDWAEAEEIIHRLEKQRG